MSKEGKVALLLMKGAMFDMTPEEKVKVDAACDKVRGLYDSLEADEEGLGSLALSYVTMEKESEQDN